MKTIVLFCVVLAALASTAVARRMDRCSLVRAMHDHGVTRGDLARWACIAEHESSYRTHVVGPANTDGSHDYGIFQINDRYWCRPSSGKYAQKSANMCNVDCDDLLDDDIGASMDCALQVKAAQGWGAWTTWKYCNGHLDSIDDCFMNFNQYCGYGFGKS